MKSNPSTKPARHKNPATAARQAAGAVPFPFLNADYPVKPWIDPTSGFSFQTVTVRLDDGRFLSVIAGNDEVRATAASQTAAEQAVMRKYKAVRTNPDPEDDETDDLAVIKKREHGRWLTLEEVLARHGR